jgi:hypothetical protein
VYLTPTPELDAARGRVDHEGRVWFAEYRGMRDRHARSRRGCDQGMEGAVAVDRRRMTPVDGQGRLGLDRLDAERPRVSRSTSRPASTSSISCRADQHPPRVRRRPHEPGALWVGSNHGGSIVKVEPILN